MEILFLDADDKALVKRYKETRRSHPLAGGGRVDEGIKKERERLKYLKRYADYILDTSNSLPENFGKNWKRSLWKIRSLRI